MNRGHYIRTVWALQTLNVFSNSYQMCIAQQFIDEKTNEIPAAQKLLELMDLSGDIVTADAMNCQKEKAACIIKRKGDYVLEVKGNQKNLYEDIKDYFDEDCPATLGSRKEYAVDEKNSNGSLGNCKKSYKLSMTKIRYKLSLDYERD